MGVLPRVVIRIEPLANLVRSEGQCVWGIVAAATHEQLRRLYAQDWIVGPARA
jgi:hypothetical protein